LYGFSVWCVVAYCGPRPAVAQPIAGEPEVQTVLGARQALDQFFTNPGESLPAAMLQKAEGVAIFPNMIKGGFILGVNYGKGVLQVRNADRTWSPPVKTNFPDATSKISGLRLSDGRYVLVSNPRPRKRDPLTLSISEDGMVFTTLYKVGPTLVALDQITGQLRWAYGPMAATTRDEANTRLEAAPAGGPLTVYAGYVQDNIEGDTHFDSSYGVRAFDTLTGRLLWDTEVCRLSPGRMATNIAASRRNRMPPHSGQGWLFRYLASSSRTTVESVSR
jgi:outer membrane protein assembly factor BamB